MPNNLCVGRPRARGAYTAPDRFFSKEDKMSDAIPSQTRPKLHPNESALFEALREKGPGVYLDNRVAGIERPVIVEKKETDGVFCIPSIAGLSTDSVEILKTLTLREFPLTDLDDALSLISFQKPMASEIIFDTFVLHERPQDGGEVFSRGHSLRFIRLHSRDKAIPSFEVRLIKRRKHR